MAENPENPIRNSGEIAREPNGQLKKGVVLNPHGRPSGSLDFKTKWNIFIDKVAKQNDMTPEQIDEQLLAVGFKKAKEGDYAFYRDIHDRVYGRPMQPTDITSGGLPILQISETIAKKNNLNVTPPSPEQNSQ